MRAFCIGVWDTFHIGHLRLIQRAARIGDDLSVGVVADEAVRAKKGTSRPVIPQAQRLEIVSALRDVTHARIVPDFEITQQIVDAYDVIVVGEDQGHIRGQGLIPAAKLHRLTRTEGVSTSAIIKRMKE